MTKSVSSSNDVKLSFEMVVSVNISELRKIIIIYLGPLGKAKLENILREIGHPKSIHRGKYIS